MGDRYFLQIDCAYCGKENYPEGDGVSPAGVYYAPTCGFETFKCGFCEKINFITSNHKAKKIEEVTLQDVHDGFEENTMGLLSEEEINRYCKERFNEVKENELEKNR